MHHLALGLALRCDRDLLPLTSTATVRGLVMRTGGGDAIGGGHVDATQRPAPHAPFHAEIDGHLITGYRARREDHEPFSARYAIAASGEARDLH